jgi:hypothetical protein
MRLPAGFSLLVVVVFSLGGLSIHLVGIASGFYSLHQFVDVDSQFFYSGDHFADSGGHFVDLGLYSVDFGVHFELAEG